MAKQQIVLNDFSGGISRLSEKKDQPYSSNDIVGLQAFDEPTALRLAEDITALTGDDIDGPIVCIEPSTSYDPEYLAYFSTIYSLYGVNRDYEVVDLHDASSDKDPTSNLSLSTQGNGLAVFQDHLYIARDFVVDMYGPLSVASANRSYTVNVFGAQSNAVIKGSGTQKYTVPTAISESSTDRVPFTSTLGNVWYLKFNVTDVTTPDIYSLTLYLHDENDNLIASASTATIHATGDTFLGPSISYPNYKQTFFTKSIYPGIVTTGKNYHIHLVTSSGSGIKVQTNVSEDLSTLVGEVFSSPLNPVYDSHLSFDQAGIKFDTSFSFHPMLNFAYSFLIIGSGGHVATFDGVDFIPSRLNPLPSGFSINSIAEQNEWVVFGVKNGSSLYRWKYLEDSEFTPTADRGYVFYWDGIQSGWNFSKRTPVGEIKAILNSKNRLMGWYGGKNSMYLGVDPFQPIQDHPDLIDGDERFLSPYGVTELNGIVYFAANQVVRNTEILPYFESGIYAYGNKVDTVPESLFLTYPIEPENEDEVVVVTAVKASGNLILAGVINDYTGTPNYKMMAVFKSKSEEFAEVASWQSLVTDDNRTSHQKTADRLVVTTREPLGTNQEIDLFADLELEGETISVESATATAGDQAISLPIYQRYEQAQVGFNIRNPDGDILEISSIVFEFDDNTEEDLVS